MINQHKLSEDEIALIDFIKWHRDEYHKADFGHTELIAEIESGLDPMTLEICYKIVRHSIDVSLKGEHENYPI